MKAVEKSSLGIESDEGGVAVSDQAPLEAGPSPEEVAALEAAKRKKLEAARKRKKEIEVRSLNILHVC